MQTVGKVRGRVPPPPAPTSYAYVKLQLLDPIVATLNYAMQCLIDKVYFLLQDLLRDLVLMNLDKVYFLLLPVSVQQGKGIFHMTWEWALLSRFQQQMAL